MEQEIRFCKTSDGVRIAYAATGAGPPLVRVLGWFTHLEFEWQNLIWRHFIDGLSARHTLIRYDGRGMGLSDREVPEFGIDASVRDLEAVVDALGLEKFAALGYSMGGSVAITYAVRHPERVSHLVIYGAAARNTMAPDQMSVALALVEQGWESDAPAHRQFFTGTFIPDGDGDAIRAFNEIQRVSAPARNVVAMLSSLTSLDVTSSLAEITVPTLVIHRRGDAVPFEGGREIAAGIRGARFLPLDGRNHLILPGEPEAAMTVRAIEELLGTAEPAGASTVEKSAGGLVTILFTDMEGSTAMTQQLGDDRAQDRVREHNTAVRDALKAHAGKEIKHTGDGIMASFASARGAVDCAIAIQRALAAGDSVRVRIGLNAGEPVAEEQDLYGTSVQMAARVCAEANGGEILVSDVVRQLVAGKGFLFNDRGDHALKGFEDPVRVYEVSWRGAE